MCTNDMNVVAQSLCEHYGLNFVGLHDEAAFSTAEVPVVRAYAIKEDNSHNIIRFCSVEIRTVLDNEVGAVDGWSLTILDSDVDVDNLILKVKRRRLVERRQMAMVENAFSFVLC